MGIGRKAPFFLVGSVLCYILIKGSVNKYIYNSYISSFPSDFSNAALFSGDVFKLQNHFWTKTPFSNQKKNLWRRYCI